MRTLAITENVTLDGYLSPMDWFDPSAQDGDLLAANAAHRDAADAVVLGRATFEQFASFWPHQTDDKTGVSDYLDRVDKYVVSSSLESADWSNSTIVRSLDEVAALKDRPGADIVVTGSIRLVHSLLPSGLVDEFRLFVYPVVQGHGEPLFPDGSALRLDLVEARSFASGVALLTYRTTS